MSSRLGLSVAVAITLLLSASAAQATSQQQRVYSTYTTPEARWVCNTDRWRQGVPGLDLSSVLPPVPTSGVFAHSTADSDGKLTGFADSGDKPTKVSDRCWTYGSVSVEYEVGPRVKELPIEVTMTYKPGTGFRFRNYQATDPLDMALTLQVAGYPKTESGCYEGPCARTATIYEREPGSVIPPEISLSGTYVRTMVIKSYSKYLPEGTWRIDLSQFMFFELNRQAESHGLSGVRAEYDAQIDQIRVG